jgi:hypothetical protein
MNFQNDNPKPKKIKYTPYDVGEGNSFVSYLSFQGYKAYGKIEGEHIQIEGKDLSEIETKLVNYLTNANKEDTIKINKREGLTTKIKLKGLAKLIKDSEEGKK